MRSSLRYTTLIVLISSIILVFGILLLFLPKSDFSEIENRPLASLKEPSVENIINGSFFGSLSNYCSDHFPMREKFTALKALSECLLLKGENNRIILGKDGHLIQKGEYESLELARKNLHYIYSFSNASNAITFIVPRGIDVMSSALPDGYAGRQNDIWKITDEILPNYLSVKDALSQKADEGNYVWYRTDHHWTSEGAYLSYTLLSRELGIIPYPEEHFHIERVTSDFYGSTHRRFGGILGKADTIKLYRYDGDSKVKVSIEESGKTVPLYDRTKLDQRDKYLVFIGGNYGRITVSDGSQGKPRMLLVKDSFANSMIPFLALHYELDVVDPRYYQGDLFALAKHADKILILMGIDTIATTPLTFR